VAQGSSPIAAVATHGVRQVEPLKTAVTQAALRAAIGRAYETVTGKAPTAAVLDTLTAQASLETGRGSQMYNWNFGGIKGVGPSGDTAACMTHEVIDSHDVTVRQGFRAYKSLDEGAVDYVRVLQHRFGGALAQAGSGNLDAFAHALKSAGYYTASEKDYAAALHAASGTSATATASLAPSKAESFLTSVDFLRIDTALSRSALRIASPDDEDG